MFFLIAETFTLLIFAIAFGAIIGWWLRYATTDSDDSSANAAASVQANDDQTQAISALEAEAAELKAQLEAAQIELDKCQQQCKSCNDDLAAKEAELDAANAAREPANNTSNEATTEPAAEINSLFSESTVPANEPETEPELEEVENEKTAALFSANLEEKPADDLKKISGVGPKLSGLLNELGVHHFSQIANFTADDIERVNKRLSFTGRIEREKWVEQAKVLAEGGETEFSKKKK